MAGARQGIAAIEPTLIQIDAGASHKAGRIAILDGERQVGGDPVPVLVGQGHGERQIQRLTALVIQLGAQDNLGRDAPVAIVVHQIQLGAQYLAAIRAGTHQIPIGIQGEGDRAAVAAVFTVQALLDG
ncbi:hypothetical protein D3C84_312840 [compost metagenome]